jgi:Rps23 Pro-64 3,4-dihydroxylase Tpa1-like proline 4-hydroxylase
MKRNDIADQIQRQLERTKDQSKSMYENTREQIGYFYVDELLPTELAQRIFGSFPRGSHMKLKKSLREYKYIAAQMDNYDPILEETIYAFQDPRIVSLIRDICGITSLYPDENLYAGGISLMGDKHFLNPHLDNSHNKDREKWRVLNLLYYVTPDWPVSQGGNLELWPDGLGGKQITLHSKFNRLVVMATHDRSWHSVSPISNANHPRCCVSNYYFSDSSLKPTEEFHVTSFRGRPEQRIRDLVLRGDIWLRSAIRKVFKKGVIENPHVYKRSNQ